MTGSGGRWAVRDLLCIGFIRSGKTPSATAEYDLGAYLRTLLQYYAIVGSDRDVIELLDEHPTLLALLVEAVKPLQGAFGAKRLLQIRVQNSGDDSLLKCAVQLPVDFPDPEKALQLFDSEWWIDNCQRSTGPLVFDYEIQDAV